MKIVDQLKLYRVEISGRPKSKIGQWLLFSLTVFGFFIILLSIVSPAYYKVLIREDGVIEYASALFWFFAALFLIINLLFLNRKQPNLWYIFLIIFFIACCGEEVSWGQRIFHFQGAQSIVERNIQHEFNIHDIGHISIFSNAFFLIFIFFFLLYPYLAFKYSRLKFFVAKYKLPVVSYDLVVIAAIVIAIWLIIGIRFGTSWISSIFYVWIL